MGVTVRRYKDQFMLSVYSNGARRTQIFPTKREAERMAVELRAALLRGTVRISAPGDGLTLVAYASSGWRNTSNRRRNIERMSGMKVPFDAMSCRCWAA